MARSRRRIFILEGLSGTEKAVRLVGQGFWQEDVPFCFPCISWAGALTPFVSVPVEPEDQKGLGQERGTDEGKREKRRDGERKRDKERGDIEAKRKGMHCSWSLPF